MLFFLLGIYKPVELWQIEDQTAQRPTKRRHGSSVFTLKEMQDATCSFSDDNLLGKGGFGKVYKGTLHSGEVISGVDYMHCTMSSCSIKNEPNHLINC